MFIHFPKLGFKQKSIIRLKEPHTITNETLGVEYNLRHVYRITRPRGGGESEGLGFVGGENEFKK